MPSKCVGRLCDPKNKHKYEGAPEGAAFRYTEKQCARACEEGSNLCKICNKHEQTYMNKPSHFFSGRMGGPLTAESHIVGSKWNIDMRAKEAVRVAVKAAKAAKAAEKEAVAAVRAATKAPMRKTLKKKKPSRSSSSSNSSSNSSSKSSSKSSSNSSSNSSSENRSSRRSSSGRHQSIRAIPHVSYRPASDQSVNQSAYVRKWAHATPLGSDNRGSANRDTLNRIVADIGLPNLPELE